MKFVFNSNHRLPKLAWIAAVEGEEQVATVTHGPWVELLEEGFIEGIWDGPFLQAAFDNSACVFGSGGVVRNQSIIFVPSTSTTDYLFWQSIDNGRRVFVANSLALLLARLDDELDPHVSEYDLINNSVMSGINNFVRKIPTKRGAVNRLIHRNLLVSPVDVSEVDKPLPPDFGNFDDYFAYLKASYGRLAMNARDPNRARPMAIFSTQSRGYDTTAANAVAKAYTIDQAFTVTKGKAKGYFADEDEALETNDDGTDICKFFGVTCQPIDRRAIERDPQTEYLFYASMHETGDFNLQQIGAHIVRPTALITGCLGEIWYPAHYYEERPGLKNGELMRVDLGNHGLTEVRLQAGYVQLAFPYIGGRSRESIFRITESGEMDPWRLGTDYDRPIPRRLAEQAGVPRSMFGQVKMASVLDFPAPILPLGKHLRAEFLDFLVHHRLLTRLQCQLFPLARRWNAVMLTTTPRRHALNYYLQRALSKLLNRRYLFPLIWERLNGTLFCFCVNRRVADYREALVRTNS